MPADSADAAVFVCEEPSTYRFEIAGDVYEYDKADYRASLRALLDGWLDAARVPVHDRVAATVELWLSVPEANPYAAQARAVVYGVPQPFVAYISIHPDEWSLTDRDIGVLGQARYPDSFGHRAGSLVVQARTPTMDPSTALAAHGMTRAATLGGGWYGYHLAPLTEGATRAAVLGDAEAAPLVARVETDTIFEWIAWRARGFVFALSGD